MPAPSSFDYALLRVVPRVERQEWVNAGVILFCLSRDFLAARVEVDGARLRALWPDVDLVCIENHLAATAKLCAGLPEAGPIARLSQRERFHWLVAPRSTIIQVSPVHTGLTGDPAATLDEIFRSMVRLPETTAAG